MEIEETLRQMVIQTPTVGALLLIVVKLLAFVDKLIDRCIFDDDCKEKKHDIQSQ